ncbi:MAG TPA: GFA family protein [Woeseiaceae bacterium]|nr:GFA family protein [Woeseiaceae bacterium]
MPSANLRWAGGENLQIYDLTDLLDISFCRTCGAPLAATHSSWPDATYLLMGALEDDSGVTPQYHIFTGSKAPWYGIHDSLPQYERRREKA